MGYVRNGKERGRGYEARWYDDTDLKPNGKPKQRSRTFATRKEARDWLISVEGEIQSGRHISQEKKETPFREVAEEWYETTAQRKPKTRAGYRSILDTHLLTDRGFRAAKIGNINAAKINLFMAKLSGAPATQRNILRVLSLVMNHAVDGELLPGNPASRAKRPEVEDAEMLFLEPEQVRTLADEITPEYRTLVLVAAYTGMRAGELVALRVSRIDFLRRELTVAESVADVGGHLHPGTPKTKKGKRTLAIPAFLADLLAQQVAGKGRDDYVFSSPQGGILRHANFMNRHFKPAVRRALPEELHRLRFHDLRHTAAALMIHANVHPKAISERLGHSSISITMDRYGKLFPSVDKAVAEKLDAIFTEAEPQARSEVATMT